MSKANYNYLAIKSSSWLTRKLGGKAPTPPACK